MRGSSIKDRDLHSGEYGLGFAVFSSFLFTSHYFYTAKNTLILVLTPNQGVCAYKKCSFFPRKRNKSLDMLIAF